MGIKERIERVIDDIETDFEVLQEKIEDNEIDDFELEDLEQLLRSFKQEIWTYI